MAKQGKAFNTPKPNSRIRGQGRWLSRYSARRANIRTSVWVFNTYIKAECGVALV